MKIWIQNCHILESLHTLVELKLFFIFILLYEVWRLMVSG